MTRTPPLLPEQALIRVLRLARINGTSVLVAAGFFAILSAVGHDFVASVAGLVVAGAGAMEIHGAALLQNDEPRGMSWLVSSQLVALLGILVYCAVRIVHVQIPPIPDDLKPLFTTSAQQYGLTLDAFLRKTYFLGIEIVAVASLLYQGGLAVYYARRRRAVQRALARPAD